MSFEKVNYIDGETVITAKNLNDIQNELTDLKQQIGETKEEINDLGAQLSGGSSIVQYKTENVGELYTHPTPYTAWTPCNLHYDAKIGKFVHLLYGAPSHVHSTADMYVVYIDPDTLIASNPQKCSYKNGSADVTPAKAATCAWTILRDGSYWMLHNDSSGFMYVWSSTDNGKTWNRGDSAVGAPASGSPWNICELSNGRILISKDETKVGFWYSDDKGKNWTHVVPATCGGGYEAEACFAELRDGVVIAIARYSMSGKGYYESGDSEHAIISVSNDHGTSWTPWQISESIDNMNASSATAIVHDGLVEVFACSRWYHNGSNATSDYINTGKSGAMGHYVATVANALLDKFTNVGNVVYASLGAGEFHSPCASSDDDGRLLIAYMDGTESGKCNNKYVRGGLNGIDYKVVTEPSIVKAYSASFTQSLLDGLTERVNYLQNVLSNIEGSGVDKPSNTWTLIASDIAEDHEVGSHTPWRDDGELSVYSWFGGYTGNTSVNSTIRATALDNELWFKLYSIGVVIERSEGAKGLSVAVLGSYQLKNNSTGEAYVSNPPAYYPNPIGNAFLVEDGFVTVYDTKTIAEQLAKYNDVIELRSGCAIVNGKIYEMRKITVSEFVAEFGAVNAYAKTVKKVLNGNETFGESDLKNAMYLGAGNNYIAVKGFKVYEMY